MDDPTLLFGLDGYRGAEVLAEIGDDRSRFADARSLKAYAGSAPGDPRQMEEPGRDPPAGSSTTPSSATAGPSPP